MYRGSFYDSVNAFARKISLLAEEEFAVIGLSPSHAILLMIVNDNQGIRPGNISSKMLLSPSTITRLIDKMEFRGLLERKIRGKYTKVYSTNLSKKLDLKIRRAMTNLDKMYSNILGKDKSRKLEILMSESIKSLDHIS